MKSIDTSVIVRFIIVDDADQAQQAREILMAGASVPLTVWLETVWVLASFYKLSRTVIAQSLLAIVDMPNMICAQEAGVRWALGRYSARGKFSDYMHIVSSIGTEGLMTFDKKMTNEAGADSPNVVEWLLR
jgi:predicted nucleic-acid-binding protein